jgi:hypothetical protein
MLLPELIAIHRCKFGETLVVTCRLGCGSRYNESMQNWQLPASSGRDVQHSSRCEPKERAVALSSSASPERTTSDGPSGHPKFHGAGSETIGLPYQKKLQPSTRQKRCVDAPSIRQSGASAATTSDHCKYRGICCIADVGAVPCPLCAELWVTSGIVPPAM